MKASDRLMTSDCPYRPLHHDIETSRDAVSDITRSRLYLEIQARTAPNPVIGSMTIVTARSSSASKQSIRDLLHFLPHGSLSIQYFVAFLVLYPLAKAFTRSLLG
ncbi:uncharacterized protein K489DRAFT_88324 [Dissoconium aciculare CBS 342.82]|uniref:Uncharacterized protein n=1 Tax=Dissoconium aciculare CBS 342.82 TaxID=1314786 RepID=A0A6J3LVN8_9PEZI|nr:uncharacterized protein K489DRAFT_88324 [Dissoconium aciculare CBS 342.82]KAF1818687.1 hypothetical protein K489DRAFT_88324 [Dissoconium aciculare CBS 342.82]